MAFGLDENGFTLKRLADIKADLESSFRAEFGSKIRTGPKSVFGIIIGILSGALAPIWELAQVCYWSLDPDRAEGVPLYNLAAVLGLSPLKATHTKVPVEISGDEGTVITDEAVVAHAGTGEQFELDETVEIPASGPIEVWATALNSGPIEATAGTITEIITPVTGWDEVDNLTDGEQGRAEETDGQLRLRMKQAPTISGSGTTVALRAKLMELEGVLNAILIENWMDFTDADGRPRNTFEAVVAGGDDDEIADLIWRFKPTAIRPVSTGATVGNEVVVEVFDPEGDPHDIAFTRPEMVEIYLDCAIDIEPGASWAPSASQEDAVAEAMLEAAEGYGAAVDVRGWRFEQAVASLDFIREHTEQIRSIDVYVGTAPNPAGDSVDISKTEVADFDSTRTTVLVT